MNNTKSKLKGEKLPAFPKYFRTIDLRDNDKQVNHHPMNKTMELRNLDYTDNSRQLLADEPFPAGSGSDLLQTVIGTSALLKETTWVRSPHDTLPAPHIFTGTKYAAVLVSRNPNGGSNGSYDCRAGSSEFDPLPVKMKLLNLPQWNNYSNCFAVAELQVTAGVTHCRQASLSTPRQTPQPAWPSPPASSPQATRPSPRTLSSPRSSP